MQVLPDKVEVVSGALVKYKGLFDFTGLYQMMRGWFEKNRFEFHEKLYKDKYFSPFGSETEIDWLAERKVSEYVKYEIKVFIHTWDMKEIEVVENGQKKKMTRARMTITLGGNVYLDYGGIFDKKKGRFVNLLGNILKKARRREIEIQYLAPLEDNVFMLQTEIKKYLNMQGKEQAYYW
ncbi:MAG: hypothetical protein V1743_05550 [Nanoarchaeota archaeon]